MSAHSSSGGASGIGGGGMSENLDLLVDYWPLQTSSTMQIPSTKEKKEVNKVGLKLLSSLKKSFSFKPNQTK